MQTIITNITDIDELVSFEGGVIMGFLGTVGAILVALFIFAVIG